MPLLRQRLPLPKRAEFWMSVGYVDLVDPAQLISDGGFSANGPTGNPTTPDGQFFGLYTITGGRGRCANNGANFGSIWFDPPATAGRTYNISIEQVAGTAGNGRITIYQGDNTTQLGQWTTTGTHSLTSQTATGNHFRIVIETMTNTNAQYVEFDDLSLKLDDTTLCNNAFNHSKDLGLKGVRADFEGQWVFFGSSAGRFWDKPDQVVSAARATGRKVCFCEVSTPDWANGAGTSQNYVDAGQASALAGCFQDAAARYAGVVDYWEIRNEQNLAGFSKDVADGSSIATCATAYVTHAIAIAAGIRAGNPRAKIVSTGLSPVPSTTIGSHLKAADYLDQMFLNGAKGVFDYIGFHPYSWPLQPDDPQSFVGWQIMESDIRAVLGKHGEGYKPIFATEFGFPTGGSGGNTEAQAGSGIITAKFLANSYADRVPIVAYYTDTDRHPAGFSSTDTEDYFGLYGPTVAAKSAPASAMRYATSVLG